MKAPSIQSNKETRHKEQTNIALLMAGAPPKSNCTGG